MSTTSPVFLTRICLTYVAICSSHPGLAEGFLVSSMNGSAFTGEELYDEYNDQDIAESETEWLSHPERDLELSQGERRKLAKRAVLLGGGESALWTTLSARWLQWIDPAIAWSVSAGVGRFTAGNIDSRYTFITTSQSLGGRFQWWPSQTFPLGLSSEFGLHQWAVNSKCGSGMNADTCSNGKLTALGGSFGAGLLLSWLAEESIVIEWTVMGFKFSKMTKSNWSGGGNDTEVEGEARSTIQGSKLVSFANFSIGWRL